MLIGVISDTHGLLRPEALLALRGSELILHAGDIGGPGIISQLATMAPVRAIRGNVDREPWAQAFPETDVVEVAGVSLYLIHDVNALDLDPRAGGFGAVISGHSHQPGQQVRKGVLYFNPGSAGPRRFKLPISIGRLRVENGEVSGEIALLG